MTQKVKSIIMRFVKGFLSTFITATGVIPLTALTDWSAAVSILNVLALAAFLGIISGIIMAAEKAVTWVK